MGGIGKPDFVTGVDRIVREEEADKAQRVEVPAEDVADDESGEGDEVEGEEAEGEEADGGEGEEQGELF